MSGAQAHVGVGGAVFGNDLPLTLIAGPCQMESREHAFMMAGELLDEVVIERLGEPRIGDRR